MAKTYSNSSLDGFAPMPLPKKLPGGWAGNLIQAFLATGEECMGKTFETEEEALRKSRSLSTTRNKVDEWKGSVTISRRDATVYLIRKDRKNAK